MGGLEIEREGSSSSGSEEVRALRALVREQGLRIAELEDQLARARACAPLDVKKLVETLNQRMQASLRRTAVELSAGLQALDDALVATEPFFDEARRPDPYLSNSGRKGTAQRTRVQCGEADSLLMSTVLDGCPLEEDEGEEEGECDDDDDNDQRSCAHEDNDGGKRESVSPLILG